MKKHNLIKIVTLIMTLFTPLAAQSASVWTLTGIVDSANGDSWSLHMISTSDSLVSENITGVYFDNLSDGLVDLNSLVNTPSPTYTTGVFAGSLKDMAGYYSPYTYPASVFETGGTLVSPDTITVGGLYSSVAVSNHAFYDYINIDTSTAGILGTGRIAATYDVTWRISDYTATRTAISTVPVPAAVWLFGSGLIGLISVARRKSHA
ncbi:MAG: VPLPA-CTERM sorting domain-containing protein [Gammaproteobacteria bacterium]|nr:VPLPA-CTERM sorting domain-containing protein [Gammaproteobacteria bacterium]